MPYLCGLEGDIYISRLKNLDFFMPKSNAHMCIVFEIRYKCAKIPVVFEKKYREIAVAYLYGKCVEADIIKFWYSNTKIY